MDLRRMCWAMGRHHVSQLQKVSQRARVKVLWQGRGQAYVTRRTDPPQAGAQGRHLCATGRQERSPADQTPRPLCTRCHQPLSSTCRRRGSAQKPPPGEMTAPPPQAAALSGRGNKPCSCLRSTGTQAPCESQPARLLRLSGRTRWERQLSVLQFFWERTAQRGMQPNLTILLARPASQWSCGEFR